MACLDTVAMLDATAARLNPTRMAARALIAGLEQRGEALCTTRFNVAELYVGIARSTRPGSEAARVASCLQGLQVLDFDDACAAAFGRLKSHLLRLGRPVGDMDVLIAATSLSHGHALVTRNPRHFADMPGVDVMSY